MPAGVHADDRFDFGLRRQVCKQVDGRKAAAE